MKSRYPFRLLALPAWALAGVATAQTIECSGSCTVTIEHEFSADTLTPERVADYLELFSAFLVAAVLVLCIKSLYNRFRIDSNHG